MKNDFIIGFADRLISSGVAKPGEIQGLPTEEIANIENALLLCLPETYKQFLLIMGRKAGNFGHDLHMFFDDSQRFLELQSFPQELFEESPTAFQLAANSIIISQHDGYQFIYMTVDNLNVDPPIHFYMEGWEQAKLINMNFAEFMLDLIRAYEK